jgi:hypothetical protein
MLDSRAVRAIAALALVVCAAGCGGSGRASHGRVAAPPGSAAPPTTAPPAVHRPALRAALVRSASTTRSARTALTSISVTVTGLGENAYANGGFDVAGTGAVDLASGDADLLLSIPLFDRLDTGGAIEERIVDGIAYARLPAPVMRLGGLPPTVRWLRIDAVRSGTAPATTLSRSRVDPAGEIEFLGAVSDDIRPVGVEAVRGTPTTHYEATIAGGTDPRSELGRRLGAVGARLGPGRVDVDVWIDGAGLARRIVVTVPLSAAGAGENTGGAPAVRMQADFYGFGAAVRPAAPPSAQVRPFAALRLPSLGA